MTDTSILFRVFNEIGIINQLSQTRFEAVMPDGMTVAQFSVLNHLVRLGGNKSPVRLANAFQVTKATMSSTLGRLESKGLISVLPDPADGRAKLVDITGEGVAMRNACIDAVAPHLAEVAAIKGMPDLAALLPLLSAMREALDNNRKI
ncbi:MAG: MarR family winged helix-turn-helix transcriptional regulator [Beijerinckiaceae bacterium]